MGASVKGTAKGQVASLEEVSSLEEISWSGETGKLYNSSIGSPGIININTWNGQGATSVYFCFCPKRGFKSCRGYICNNKAWNKLQIKQIMSKHRLKCSRMRLRWLVSPLAAKWLMNCLVESNPKDCCDLQELSKIDNWGQLSWRGWKWSFPLLPLSGNSPSNLLLFSALSASFLADKKETFRIWLGSNILCEVIVPHRASQDSQFSRLAGEEECATPKTLLESFAN